MRYKHRFPNVDNNAVVVLTTLFFLVFTVVSSRARKERIEETQPCLGSR